jgi:hypothetical protein
MIKTFIYVAPHVVGTAESWGYCYDTDFVKNDTRELAQKHGERTLGHDDFLVAELTDGKFVALYSGNEKRTDPKELERINKEFGNE